MLGDGSLNYYVPVFGQVYYTPDGAKKYGYPGAGIYDHIVRPAVPIISTLKDRTPAAVEVPLQASEKRWGKASSFQWSVTAVPGLTSFTTGAPDDDSDEEAAAPGSATLDFTETDRKVKVVRIFNPSDHEQYVDFLRTENITFSAPGNLGAAIEGLKAGTVSDIKFRFTLKNPEVNS